MKYRWVEERLAYDGSQLASLFNYQRFGLLGDSVVAWTGACDVTVHMVDAEDQRAGALIRGSEMVHFIAELFHEKLSFGVSLQRIFAGLVIDHLERLVPSTRGAWERDGDDVYFVGDPGRKKLSISIATVSATSVLMHFAVNVSNDGTPVATCALSDFAVDPEVFGVRLLKDFSAEVDSIREATMKVHPVGSYQPSP